MSYGDAFPRSTRGERYLRDGSLAVTPTQLGLLQGLLDRPDATTHTRIDWVRASRPHLRWAGLATDDALVESTFRLPASWVAREKLRGRFRCTLAERGRDILERRVPASIIGYGPYRGTAPLLRFSRRAARAGKSAHERQWIPAMNGTACLVEICAVFSVAARWLRRDLITRRLHGDSFLEKEVMRVAAAMEACVRLAKASAWEHEAATRRVGRTNRVAPELHDALWALAQVLPDRLDDMLDYNNAWAAHGVCA